MALLPLQIVLDWPGNCSHRCMRKIDGVPMRREPEDDLLGKLRELVAEDERVDNVEPAEYAALRIKEWHV